MAKIFETNEEIVELVKEQFNNTRLNDYGVHLKIMSLPKAKDIMKVSRANAAIEHLTRTNDLITVFIYEAAFERLDEESQKIITEMMLSGISYDTEKDRILLDTNPYHLMVNMKRKYGNDIINKIELSIMVIEEIEEEEKQRKEAEKAAKKNKNNN